MSVYILPCSVLCFEYPLYLRTTFLRDALPVSYTSVLRYYIRSLSCGKEPWSCHADTRLRSIFHAMPNKRGDVAMRG